MASVSTRSGKSQLENQSRAKWTVKLTETLIELMIDEVCNGNKTNKSFNMKAWKSIGENFRNQTGEFWHNDQLKSRYISLRKLYTSVKSLLDHPDFEWDETTGAITGTEEAWNRHLKESPDADALRTSGCPIYNQLKILFVDSGTCPKQNASNKGCDEITSSLASPCDLTLKHEELSPSESDKYPDLVNRKRTRRGTEDAIARGILEMANAAKYRAEAIKKSIGKYSISDCVSALDELQGVSDNVYFAAVDLFENPNARETFLGLKAEKRLVWLQHKCLRHVSS